MKTNSNNINNSKSNKTKLAIVLTSLIIILSIVNIALLSGTIFGININTTTDANALSYSTNENISFTFKPTLSIGLSTDSLTIDNLVPGTTSDSAKVSVTVSSNTQYGYVLSAGVGSTVFTDPYYNTSDLVHDNSTTEVPTTNKFSSISTTSSLQTLDTDNTWGYSTSTDGGTSWSAYSGLSHTATKPLLDISAAAQPSTIDFKIAARSASTQASGTYNNVITFYAVGKPEPVPPSIDDLTYLQDFTTLSDIDEQAMIDATPIEVVYTLKDQRDNQDYTIAKLKDGKIWMTKNLNLKGGTAITSELSDIPSGYTLPTANNFQSGNRLPYSAGSGFNDDTKAFVYNSTKTYDCYSPGCYSYYSWGAATAGSGLSISAENADAPYSICPKGWRLPTSGGLSNGEWKRGDFYTLATAYGADLENDYVQYSSSFYDNAGPYYTGTPRVPNFLLAGYYYGNPPYTSTSFIQGESRAGYWSSTSYSSGEALVLSLNQFSVSSPAKFKRRFGVSVRCLVK